MQLLSRVALLLGIVIVIAAAILLGRTVIDINQLHAVANVNRNAETFNPVDNVLLMAGLALAGGFLTGLGLRLGRRRPAGG